MQCVWSDPVVLLCRHSQLQLWTEACFQHFVELAFGGEDMTTEASLQAPPPV